jgi:hypothetical protein
MTLIFNPQKLSAPNLTSWHYENKYAQDILADIVMPVITVTRFHAKSRILQNDNEKTLSKS